MKFLSGIVAGLAILAVTAGAVIATGLFNFAATIPAGRLEKRVAQFALDRSVARRAPRSGSPLAASAEALQRGLTHYRQMCVTCHGAPGVDASDIGEGLNPPAPDLTLARVQGRTDGELFWMVQNGIRMTGMPAFGPTHKDEEIWKIVAFLRQLPEISAEEQRQLRAAP